MQPSSGPPEPETWASIEQAARHLFRGSLYPGIHYYRWVVSSSLKARPDGRSSGSGIPGRRVSRSSRGRRPMGTKCSILATWPRRTASAHRRSARSPSVERSSTTSARARTPPMSSRVSSGFQRSRSPTTSPTSLARSGRRGSGCASSRPGVSAAASSSESGTASIGPRPAQFAGVSTSRRRASPSSRPESDPRNSRWCPGAAASIRVCDASLRAGQRDQSFGGIET